MKSSHQRLAKSQGTLQGPVQGLLLCTPLDTHPPLPRSTSSSHWPPALWKGLSVSLARWQTCRMQEQSVDAIKDLIFSHRQHVSQENWCLSTDDCFYTSHSEGCLAAGLASSPGPWLSHHLAGPQLCEHTL